jgi:hypothetical protein
MSTIKEKVYSNPNEIENGIFSSFDLNDALNYAFRSDAGHQAQKELLRGNPTKEQIKRAMTIKSLEEKTRSLENMEFSQFENQYVEDHKGNYAQALDAWVDRKLKENQEAHMR